MTLTIEDHNRIADFLNFLTDLAIRNGNTEDIGIKIAIGVAERNEVGMVTVDLTGLTPMPGVVDDTEQDGDIEYGHDSISGALLSWPA